MPNLPNSLQEPPTANSNNVEKEPKSFHPRNESQKYLTKCGIREIRIIPPPPDLHRQPFFTSLPCRVSSLYQIHLIFHASIPPSLSPSIKSPRQKMTIMPRNPSPTLLTILPKPHTKPPLPRKRPTPRPPLSR